MKIIGIIIALSSTGHESVNVSKDLANNLWVVVACGVKDGRLCQLHLLLLYWILSKILRSLTSLSSSLEHFLFFVGLSHCNISSTLFGVLIQQRFILNFRHQRLRFIARLSLKDIRWLSSWTEAHAKFIGELIRLNHSWPIKKFSISSTIALMVVYWFWMFLHYVLLGHIRTLLFLKLQILNLLLNRWHLNFVSTGALSWSLLLGLRQRSYRPTLPLFIGNIRVVFCYSWWCSYRICSLINYFVKVTLITAGLKNRCSYLLKFCA